MPQVRTLAQDLVSECRAHLVATSRPASGASGSTPGAPAAPATPAAQQAALVYHLNKSGRYLAAKEQLKGAVLRVVAASRTPDAGSDEAVRGHGRAFGVLLLGWIITGFSTTVV
jgi:hypothetical protein